MSLSFGKLLALERYYYTIVEHVEKQQLTVKCKEIHKRQQHNQVSSFEEGCSQPLIALLQAIVNSIYVTFQGMKSPLILEKTL
jgi:hypothetical protein